MDLIRWDHHSPHGDFLANKLGREVLALGDEFHFGRGLSGTGGE